VGVERQKYVFDLLFDILGSELELHSKEEARSYFNQLRQRFVDWNYSEWESDEFADTEKEIRRLFEERSKGLSDEAKRVKKQAESKE
jgi:V/A-type H+-transporting ATPase subunit A